MEEKTLAALSKKPWWDSDKYVNDTAVVDQIYDFVGPKGLALVKAWPNGMTDAGWGLTPKKVNGKTPDPNAWFMPKYMRDDFNSRRVIYGYEKGKWAFAIVMRSVRLVCIDIDGKNGGIEHAKRLGLLPPTLAETSKSGDGYHLFYFVDDLWTSKEGYGGYADHIGIEQGVDIRSVGCVYHHDNQRWNGRDIVPLPEHMKDLMLAARQRRDASNARVVSILQTGDPVDTLMLQDELVTSLKKPIDAGKRNTTLFAIGQKMKQAGTPDWQTKVYDRAIEVGLDAGEADKLVQNIGVYN